MEEWKEITDYPNYSVSNLGRVKNNTTNRILYGHDTGKYYKNGKGYLAVHLGRNPNKFAKVHRLVAIAFVPNPDNKPFVNHIDGDTHNNVASNLEWCTNRENVIHSFTIDKNRKENHARANRERCNRPIVRLEDGKVYPSIKSASEDIGGNRHNICNACRGVFKTSGGYHWAYYEKEI